MPPPKKNAGNVQPDGQIRKSQVVTTYGPGAMVDLVDTAVLIGGLDFWHYDKRSGRPGITYVHEPRLRDAIAERFVRTKRELSIDKPFRAPPQGDDREPGRFAGIQVLEFPQWVVCQNPSCRQLIRTDGVERKGGRYRHQCTRDRSFECVPIRFIGACRKGHAQDFPWILYAHLSKEICAGPSLRLHEGASGDFAEIRVACDCGASQALVTAMGNIELPCRGEQPWLGTEGRVPECKERLRLLVRTASNSYFAQVVSALSIPEPGRELEDAVQEHWETLKVATPQTLPAFRTIPSIRDALARWSDDEVLRVVRARAEGKTSAREPLRSAEYKQLVASPKEKLGDLPPRDADPYFFAREAKLADKPAGIARVVLAHQLREVRAQIGFTRLEPISPDLQGEYDLEVQSAPLGLTTTWLPATEIRGEGVLVQLEEKAVLEWESRPAVKERADELLAGYRAWVASLSAGARAPAFPGVRFYLLHSLSHLLISAISLECGYSASAIRERIYCGPSESDPATAMAAILLSTGTSGSEGTLGGLVTEGRKIRDHLRSAFDLGKLCSNDPVCATHSPQDDPAERHLEGAACHGCLFLAECSCERFNRYLDRSLVVPTLGHPAELAFFGTRP